MNDNVRRSVAEGNDWYLADQRQSQLGTPGSKWALAGRWRLFAEVINVWLGRQSKPSKSLRILDAGCGDGINMSVLNDIFVKHGIEPEIIGSDYNGVRLERAIAHGSFPVVEADLRQTPFKDAEFDVILCSHVLEHIPEDVSAMRELSRILAPDGLLLLAVPNEGCAMAWLRNHVVQRSILRTTDHIHFYTASEFLAKASAADLRPFGRGLHEGFFLPHLGLYVRLRETRLGRSLIAIALRLMPSQAAGLVAGFEKMKP
jgi:2-polyprenyl-3-methyl-5-hydroxy-6-metoxy-1,4-benzoquinol methylase